MQQSKKINLTKGRTHMINVNDDSDVNVTLNVTIITSKPIEFAITTQEELDSDGNLKYEHLDDTKELEVGSNDGVLHTFVILFRSNEDCDVTVNIVKHVNIPVSQPSQQPTVISSNTSGGSKLNYTVIGLIAFVCIGVAVGLFFFFRVPNTNEVIPYVLPIAALSVTPSVLQSSHIVESPKTETLKDLLYRSFKKVETPTSVYSPSISSPSPSISSPSPSSSASSPGSNSSSPSTTSSSGSSVSCSPSPSGSSPSP